MWIRLFIIFLIVSCVPEQGKEKAACGKNEAFNSMSRKCYAVNAPRGAPSPSTATASINEDSGANVITLNYSDSENDYATVCSITSFSTTLDNNGLTNPSCSCVGGVCSVTVIPDSNFFGTAQLIYQLADDDGTSSSKILKVTVNAIDDGPVNSGTVPTSIITVNEDTTQSVTLNYTDAENELATACGITLSTKLQTVSSCSCNFLGVCTFSFAGASNFNGTGEYFKYRVYVNGQWSSYSTVFVDVSAVNDTPTLASGSQSVTILEDHTGAAGDLVVTAGSDTDTATNGDVLKYSVVTAVSKGTLANCLNTSGTPTTDRDCYYTPTANLSNDNLQSTCLYDNLIRFTADTAGTSGNSISVVFTDNNVTIPTVSVAGNVITVTMDVGNTTGYQIKSAVDGNASAAALVNTYLLGSRTISAQGTCSLTGSWGTQYDFFTYKVTDTLGPVDASTINTVNISITPANDAPTVGSAFDVNSTATTVDNLATEDTVFNFYIGGYPADNDIKDSISYTFDSTNSLLRGGTLTNCMDLAGSDGPSDLTCTYTPTANFATDAAYSFDGDEVTIMFTFTDGTSTSATQTIYFDVAPSNDPPTVCQYSSYKENPKCGLLGCKGSSTPIGNVTPAEHDASKPIYYYNTGNGTCYKSTGTTSSDWTTEDNGFIKNYTVTQGEPIIIKRLILDEGGSDTSENTQSISSIKITSDNTSLINPGNFYYKLSTTTTWSGPAWDSSGAGYTQDNSPFGGGDAASSSDTIAEYDIKFIPTAAAIGTANMNVYVCDSGSACRSIDFTITVESPSATHNGWSKLTALGPKVNIKSEVLDQSYSCPYSRTSCNTGGACVGTTDPTSAAASPDNFNAIYLNTNGTTTTSDDTCYLSVGSKTVQGLTFKTKTKTDVRIVIDSSITSVANENVDVDIAGSIYKITIYAVPNVTTLAKIKFLIENDNDATFPADGDVDGFAAYNYVDVSYSSASTKITGDSDETITFSSSNSWITLEMYCNVSDSTFMTYCSDNKLGASCIGNGSASSAVGTTFTNTIGTDFYYYDRTNNKCYRSYDTGSKGITDGVNKPDGWEEYKAVAEVTLTWEEFDIAGSGTITGYNVYRRLKGASEFDFESPINREVLDATATSYVDNSRNSIDAPVPNTRYEYEVRPLLEDGVASDTSDDIEAGATESFRIVDMIVPANNLVLGHRWMLNKRVCELMKKTPDKNYNYRCSYEGPGVYKSVGAAATGTQGIIDSAGTFGEYYDNYYHIVTSRGEIGCPYSFPDSSGSGGCTWTSDHTCIGKGNPTSATGYSAPSVSPTIYYDRTGATCYVYSGGTWRTYDGTPSSYNTNITDNIISNSFEASELPPLTNIDQAQAHNFCADVDYNDDFGVLRQYSSNSSDSGGAPIEDLPSRQHQIALSIWDSTVSDSTATTLEEGLSLNSSAKCNSSGASGYESYYSDDEIPPVEELFTLPGTASSGYLSIITNSTITNQCVSHIGAQDLIGNVEEWSDNISRSIASNGLSNHLRFMLTNDDATATTDPQLDVAPYLSGTNTLNVFHRYTSSSADVFYIFGLTVTSVYQLGPYYDSTGSANIADGVMTSSWTIADESYNTGYMFVPYGLPVNNWYVSTSGYAALATPHTTITKGISEIGPSSGITSSELHSDKVDFSTTNSTVIMGVTGGGNYSDGTGAGVFNMKLQKTNSRTEKIGFRCIYAF